jgi:hypothetical protein
MKLIVIFCNIFLVVYTCFVLITDGISKEALYIVLTLLLLLVPVFNLAMILYYSTGIGWLDFRLKRKPLDKDARADGLSSKIPTSKIVTIICNIVLLGFSCWVFIDQFPHPKEEGLIFFIVIVFLTPILSSIALFLKKN